jgi:hypothetical protein
MTSRVSAGLTLSKVAPEVESTHSPAMKWRKVGGSADGPRSGAAAETVSVVTRIYTA